MTDKKKRKVLGDYNKVVFGELNRGQVTPGEYSRMVAKPKNK